MPSRARLDEFIAVVEAGDHAGAIERYYTEDASMQENTLPPRVGRDALVARERGGPSSILGSAAARLVSASIEISTPGKIAPPRYSPFALTASIVAALALA